MIKVVSTIGFNHSDSVINAVNSLQKEGHEVTRIQRKEKMTLGIFGEDVTHVTYIEKN